MPLILEFPLLYKSGNITTFIPSPHYIWPTVNLENATVIMDLDGHEFIVHGKTEQSRLRNLLFLSSQYFPRHEFLNIPERTILEAFIKGAVQREVGEGFYAQQIFTKIHVSEMRFKTTTELLQERKGYEILNNRLLEDLMKLLK